MTKRAFYPLCAYQTVPLGELIDDMSRAYRYQLLHLSVFGFLPPTSWLEQHRETVMRRAALRFPVVWC